MEKIMILGAGRGQVDLIRAVKKYGYSAVVASTPGNYPGFAFADEICHVDISNQEAVAQAAKEKGVIGIVTACLDTGIAALGYTCEKNNLKGLSELSSKLSENKWLMKKAFMDNNVNTAQYEKISSIDDLETVIDKLNFPLIVKAIDLQGSRGINIAHTRNELLTGFQQTMKETQQDFCIVEEFIEEYEFGAQAFVVDDEILYILPCGDLTYLGSTKIPVGHFVPVDLPEHILNSVTDQVTRAIKAIKLNNCAVNVDMIIKNDKVYVIELTGRVGANCLPQLSSIYYGIDVYKLIIDTACGGGNPKKYFESTRKEPTACYAKMLISEKSGVIKKIINHNMDNPNIVEITLFVEEGDEVRKFTNSRDCIGQVVVKGKNLQECEALINNVVKNISFELEVEV